MWLKDCWQVAAFAKEVGRSILARKFLGEPVILFRTGTGEVVAMEDCCPHRCLPLSMGQLVGDHVRCGYHGMEFDHSGQCVAVPGQDQIPPKAKARTYPVVQKYNLVWIWMGEPALASEETVPDAHWLDDPEWVPSEGYHLIGADYRLLNDNLLDLSHETFVHKETIGNGAVADSPLSVEVVPETCVRAHRLMRNCEPPPLYVEINGFTSNIDRWHTTNYFPPGYHMIESGAVPAGMDVDEARRRGLATERRNLTFITPETETSSHYFWASTRNFKIDDEAMTHQVRHLVDLTFTQDKVVLEAQQKMLSERHSDAFPVALRADLGAIQGRRLLASKLDKEKIARPG